MTVQTLRKPKKAVLRRPAPSSMGEKVAKFLIEQAAIKQVRAMSLPSRFKSGVPRGRGFARDFSSKGRSPLKPVKK